MAGKGKIQKQRITDNHAFSKLDFYRRSAAILKSIYLDNKESIKYEFEKLLKGDGCDINNANDALQILNKALDNI